VFTSTFAQPKPFTVGKLVCAGSMPSLRAAKVLALNEQAGSHILRTSGDQPMFVVLAVHQKLDSEQRTSVAAGTGTQWLRRKYPASPSIPPF
jgi:hypothetical protein